MTALDNDPYIAAAQQRILTLAEKRVLAPTERLTVLRNSLGNLRRAAHVSIADKNVIDLLLDLVDVVDQLAEPAGAAVEYALMVDHEDGEAREYVPAVDPSHAEQMARTIYRGRPTWTVGREPDGPWRYVRRGATQLTAEVTR